MAMKEGKGTQNHQNMVKIICDKLVDSQIELNSSEFWFCFEVKLTGNFAYFVVSANLSKHTMHHHHHHQPKLGGVYFSERLKELAQAFDISTLDRTYTITPHYHHHDNQIQLVCGGGCLFLFADTKGKKLHD